MNIHPNISNNEDQKIAAFINLLTVPPSNSSLDKFMTHELPWISTPEPFDSKMLVNLPLDTYQTYPMDISSFMPWYPMTPVDFPTNGSMIDLNPPFLSHSSSSPLSYPSISTPLDPNNELILPPMSDISFMWSSIHEQVLPNPLTPPSRLSFPTFIDASTITTTNPPSQLASYHPSPRTTPNTLQLINFMNPNLQPALHTKYRSKRFQSVNYTKKHHICQVNNCFQAFKRPEHLKRHLRCVHLNHRPYKCPISACSKLFSRTDNLSAHLKIHQRRKSTLI